MECRHCGTELTLQLVDLGTAPPSNNFNDGSIEKSYPLKVLVCTECWLAQTDTSSFSPSDLFTDDYPYFSSISSGLVSHAKQYVEMATERFKLDENSLMVEVGSNDGYLLQFVKTPCYGVEPTLVGEKAKEKGIISCSNFFSNAFSENAIYWRNTTTGTDGHADLMIANNVLAHVPDINDFVRGFETLLKPTGVATFEFPHLLNLVTQGMFDTIYHEHYSYLSLVAVERIFKANGLSIFDVEEIKTHGGSLRVYADKGTHEPTENVRKILLKEYAAGMTTKGFYRGFQEKVDGIRDEFRGFLLKAKDDGKQVAGFGAAAKASTLLNYANIASDLLPYIVDDCPQKQGKFVPGCRIPVQKNFITKPDYVVIFPWNIKEDIMKKLDMECTFVTAIPKLCYY